MKNKDIFWLAGLLEGEGSFSMGQRSAYKGQPRYRSPQITVGSTDRDVIEHVANLFDRAYYGPYTNGREGFKPIYSTKIGGRPAISWMLTLYPLMGIRRKAKISEVIQDWKSTSRYPKVSL